MTTPELLAALEATEQRAGAVVFSAKLGDGDHFRKVATADEAVRSASALSGENRRASVMLLPSEVVGAAGALAAAARLRAPLVVHVVGNPDPPACGRDELAATLDLGVGVVVTWCAEDALDMAVAARRAAEDSETPFVVFHEQGGVVSEPHDAERLARFLGDCRARAPIAQSEVAQKRAERAFAARAPFALASALREVGQAKGRALAPIERFETADAETVVVAVGSMFPVARSVAAALRKTGRRTGAVGVRALRPFFSVEIVKALARAKAVGVVEPVDIALAPAGPVALALKAAFSDALTWASGYPGIGHIPPIVSAGFATLDEGAIGEAAIHRVFNEIELRDRATRTLVFGSD